MDSNFLAQFERVDDGYLYRKNQKGPAFKCSEREKDQFFADYIRSSRWLIRGSVLAISAILTITFLVAPNWLEQSVWPTLFIACGLLLFYFPAAQIIYGAPEKILEKSIPVSPELTKQEWQKKHFKSTSWGLLLGITGFAATIFGFLITKSPFSAAIDYMYLVGSGAVLLVGLRSLWLKFHL